MGKIAEAVHFGIETFYFKVRDLIKSPEDRLKETGIQPGWNILDFGCGIGGYSIAAARIVGKQGHVYAADCRPLAVGYVTSSAKKNKLDNVEVILTDCKTGIESGTIDIVLLYDILHDLHNSDEVLSELARVLRPDGILSLSDHHLSESQIMISLAVGGLFKLANKGELTYTFKLSGDKS